MKTKEKIWEEIWTVYLIEYQNVVKYVGKTCDFVQRKSEHLRMKEKSAIPTDVDLNEIEIIPIETYNTEIDALKREDELILQYDTINTGWNQCRSGLVYCDKEYIRKYRSDYMKSYRQTEKAKAYQRDYSKTKKHKDYQREYLKTDKQKEYQREWHREYYRRKKAEKLQTVND